jgi:hypothetical protein
MGGMGRMATIRKPLSLRVRPLFSIVVAICVPLTTPQLQLDAPCHVTLPNGVVAGSPERQEGSYGNALLSVGAFGLWPEGTVIFKPGGAGFVTRNGALGMKFGWTRAVRGKLNVTGHRLDGAARPLRLDANNGDGDIGFQATYLIFPTAGCWEVTAQVGEQQDSKLTFVTRIVKIGEGPARWDPSQ